MNYLENLGIENKGISESNWNAAAEVQEIMDDLLEAEFEDFLEVHSDQIETVQDQIDFNKEVLGLAEKIDNLDLYKLAETSLELLQSN